MKSTNSWKTMNITICKSRTGTVAMIALIASLSFMGASAFAKAKPDCDCGDVKFVPSKDRIKITRAKAVDKQIRAIQTEKPTEYKLLKKIITTADTFLQRHMNGEIYQDQAPDDWDEYNGSIMAMTMEEWMRMKLERRDKDSSQWLLCPNVQMDEIVSLQNTTVIKYKSVTVGRSLPERIGSYNLKFSDAENSTPFSIEIEVNNVAKVTNFRQTPQGYSSYPYTRILGSLKQRIKEKQVTDFGEALKKITANNVLYLKEINKLENAAKICGSTVKIGK